MRALYSNGVDRITRRSRLAMTTLCVALMGVQGCAYLLRSPSRPTPGTHYGADGADASECLLIMLPGALDSTQEFETRGVVDELQHELPGCDLLALDTHLWDYLDGSIVDRVHEDAIVPARQRGYRRILLLGISMGAIGAILVARAHPADVEGLVLVGPFLGTNAFITELARELRAVGGLASWAASRAERPTPRIDRILQDPRPVWQWLAGYLTAPEAMPPLYLGYGRGDQFGSGQALLADAIDPERRFAVAGSHDWDTWARVLREVLVSLTASFGDVGGAERAAAPLPSGSATTAGANDRLRW